MRLRCTLHSQDQTDVLTMVGDIDMDGAEELRRVTGALGVPRRPLRVDLTKVAFMDLTGAHFLADLQRRSTVSGTSLVLVGMHPGPVRLLGLLGLTGFCLERPQRWKPDG